MPNHCHFSSRSSFPVALFFLLVVLSGFSNRSMAQIHLLPAPREAHFGATTPLGTVQVTVPGQNEDDQFAARDLEAALKQPA